MGAGVVAISSSDVIILDGQVVSAYAGGDAVMLSFDGDIGKMKISKDGNAVYALDSTGLAVKVTLKLVRGSYDDQTLNSKLQGWLSDPVGFTLMTGSFVKRLGDGKGNVISEVYQMSGGIFTKIPKSKMNVAGDTEQSVVEYEMVFRNNSRLMQ